jgi:hypothetical protein
MQVPHPDFGGSGVMMHLCDNPRCRKPIRLRWKGSVGEYCSNKCYREMEVEKHPREANSPEPSKVNTQPVKRKVNSARVEKVNAPPLRNVNRPAEPSKVNTPKAADPILSLREQKQRKRRARIRSFCAKRRTASLREIAEHLDGCGLHCSLRTIWLDLQAVGHPPSAGRPEVERLKESRK